MKKLSLFILGAVLSLQAHADATVANARAILHAYGIAATLSGTYTFSDDNILYVSARDREIKIPFNISSDSSVSISVNKMDGRLVSNVLNAQHIGKGVYTRSILVNENGVYVITLNVNGRVYFKKVQVF